MDFGVAETPRPVGKAPAIVPPSTVTLPLVLATAWPLDSVIFRLLPPTPPPVTTIQGQAQTPSDDPETLLARVEGELVLVPGNTRRS